MLQVEEVRFVTNRLKLRRDGAHDRDDDTVREMGIDGRERVGAFHVCVGGQTRLTASGVRPRPATSGLVPAAARRDEATTAPAFEPSRSSAVPDPDDPATRI